jgi:Tol biopolymer transport system component
LRRRGDEAPPQGRIVFAATATGEAHSDLYAMDDDGTHLTRLTNTPSESEQFPRWSPDRSRIAYIRGGSLMVSNRNGQDVHVVTTTVGRNGTGITAPDWSPDGTKLVYLYPRPPFNVDLGQGDGIIDGATARICTSSTPMARAIRRFQSRKTASLRPASAR